MGRTTFPSDNDWVMPGTADFTGTVSLPAGTITSDQFSSTTGDALDADKQEHRFVLNYWQASGSDVATATAVIHTVRATGSIIAVEVTPDTAPTGGDKQFTANVLSGNAGSAYSTVLSSVVTVNSSSADRTPQAGTINTAALADGDSIQVILTASGSTGSQGDGVNLCITIEENPS